MAIDKNVLDRFDPMFAVVAGEGELALAELGLSADAKVLDVGTGVGNFATILGLSGFDVTTGEPATDETHYAGLDWQETARKGGVEDRVRFVPFDGSAMPFDDGAFDAVFFFGVLHHVDEKDRAATLSEAVRVAKPGAPVVLFEPRQEFLGKIRENDPGHPEPADPNLYTQGLTLTQRVLHGQIMDIYIYSQAAG